MSATTSVDRGADLAAEADFLIGSLRVSPSTARVCLDGEETRVEPRVMEVLLILWRAAGKTVTRDQLVDACWGGRAVSDDAISRAVAKVRQLAETGGRSHFTIETLPKVGFRLLPGAGSPPFAPARAEGMPPVGFADPLRRLLTSRPKIAMIAGATVLGLVVASTFFLLQQRGSADDLAAGIRLSPFVAMRPEQPLSRLSTVTREAIARLLTADGLRPQMTESAPASSGGPEYEIAGTLDHDGAYFVAWISIVERDYRTVLWSGRFESRGPNGEGLDARVAGAVADVLKCALLERKAKPQIKNELWTQFLNACGAVYTDKLEAVDLTTRLLTALPDDAGALALRAQALAQRARRIDEFKAEALAMAGEAIAAATRAIAIDPGNAAAYAVLGRRLGDAPRYVEREESLKRARTLDPSSGEARIQYALLLRDVGRTRAALEIAQDLERNSDQRLQADPQLAFLYAVTGEQERAHRVLDRIDVTFPDDAASVRWTIALWWEDQRGLTDDFWRTWRKDMGDRMAACLRQYFRTLGDGQSVHRGLPSDCAVSSRDWQIRMLAREGDIDGAYALTKDMLPNSRRWMFLFYPEMKAFRRDPRFADLIERLGLLTYWRETGNWPDFCRDEAPIGFCPQGS